MGLLDDMAAAQREMKEKPEGWKTTVEFADQMGVSRDTAARILKRLVKTGELETRRWTSLVNGNEAAIYGEPE